MRPGIVAADPRIFPLARYVEVFMGNKYLGRFLVDDTGRNVIGATLDIWTPSCRRHRGLAGSSGAPCSSLGKRSTRPSLAQLRARRDSGPEGDGRDVRGIGEALSRSDFGPKCGVFVWPYNCSTTAQP